MRSVWELLLLAVLCAERWREGEARLQKKHVMDVHPADAFNSTIVIGVPISYDIEDIYYQVRGGRHRQPLTDCLLTIFMMLVLCGSSARTWDD